MTVAVAVAMAVAVGVAVGVRCAVGSEVGILSNQMGDATKLVWVVQLVMAASYRHAGTPHQA